MDTLDATYDVALSYAFSKGSSHEKTVIDDVRAQLSSANVRVYEIREDKAVAQRRWKHRFYQNLYKSRLFVPVLSRNYLRGEGARLELSAMQELTQTRANHSFFYPLLPIVPDAEYLRSKSMSITTEQDDLKSYEWVRSHAFPILLDWGASRITQFLDSLVHGAAGEPNLEWLHAILDQVQLVCFESILGNPYVVIHVQNHVFENDFEFRIGPGGVRFSGCIFRPRNYLSIFDRETIISHISEHIEARDARGKCKSCGFRSRSRALSTCPVCSQTMCPAESISAADIDHAQRTGKYICEQCGNFGVPTAWDVGGACEKCGGAVQFADAHAIRRFLLYKFRTKGPDDV